MNITITFLIVMALFFGCVVFLIYQHYRTALKESSRLTNTIFATLCGAMQQNDPNVTILIHRPLYLKNPSYFGIIVIHSTMDLKTVFWIDDTTFKEMELIYQTNGVLSTEQVNDDYSSFEPVDRFMQKYLEFIRNTNATTKEQQSLLLSGIHAIPNSLN